MSASLSASFSASVSASPSVGSTVYTKGDYATLPLGIDDLENLYTEQEMIDVSSSDNVRVSQTATGEYTIHQFKDYVDASKCMIVCEGQSNLRASSSTVYLQIYNVNTSSWEDIASNSVSPEDVDFTLTASISDLTNYSNSGLVTCRVFQEGL